jgi:hypothetical protein
MSVKELSRVPSKRSISVDTNQNNILTEDEKVEIYGTSEEREKIGNEVAELIKTQEVTGLPFKNGSFTKPDKWSDKLWERFSDELNDEWA